MFLTLERKRVGKEGMKEGMVTMMIGVGYSHDECQSRTEQSKMSPYAPISSVYCFVEHFIPGCAW